MSENEVSETVRKFADVAAWMLQYDDEVPAVLVDVFGHMGPAELREYLLASMAVGSLMMQQEVKQSDGARREVADFVAALARHPHRRAVGPVE